MGITSTLQIYGNTTTEGLQLQIPQMSISNQATQYLARGSTLMHEPVLITMLSQHELRFTRPNTGYALCKHSQ